MRLHERSRRRRRAQSEEEWSHANYMSYSHVADFFWHSMLPITNHLRVNILGLKTLRFGAFGGSLLTSCHVPFVKMWSPALCPKPSDWRAADANPPRPARARAPQRRSPPAPPPYAA